MAVKLMKKIALIIFLLVISFSVSAEVPLHTFTKESDQVRFRELTNELRCPKCQNQDLADSNAPIASDLRNQIIGMIEQGKSNEEIINYMVERYGDFVLYKPRFQGYNVLLWLAPLFFITIGVLIVMIIMRANKQTSVQLPLDNEVNRLKFEQLLNQKDKV
jgi:cytochrome c-type biogenesis protein CcmH